jgi:hypothetical protein
MTEPKPSPKRDVDGWYTVKKPNPDYDLKAPASLLDESARALEEALRMKDPSVIWRVSYPPECYISEEEAAARNKAAREEWKARRRERLGPDA